jgi:hypothetical protein
VISRAILLALKQATATEELGTQQDEASGQQYPPPGFMCCCARLTPVPGSDDAASATASFLKKDLQELGSNWVNIDEADP